MILTSLIFSTASVIVAEENFEWPTSRQVGIHCDHVITYILALKCRRQLMLPFYGNHYRSKAFTYVHCKCLRTTIENIFWHLNNVGVQSPLSKHMTKQMFCLPSIVVFDSIEPTMKPLSESSHGAFKARSQFSDLLNFLPQSPYNFIPSRNYHLCIFKAGPSSDHQRVHLILSKSTPFFATPKQCLSLNPPWTQRSDPRFHPSTLLIYHHFHDLNKPM